MNSRSLKKISSSMLAVILILTLGGNKVASAEEITKERPRVSVHDPSIVKDGDTYYAFGSHIDAAKSTDLKDWKVFTNGYTKTENVLFGDLSKNLAGSFAWAGENDSDSKGGFAVWAPTVFKNENYVNKDGTKGAYVMYYCTSSTYKRSAIGFAISKNIEGPYEYVDTIMYSGFTKNANIDANSTKNTIYTNTNIDELISGNVIKNEINSKWFLEDGQYNTSYAPNAIDPELFYDEEGKLWMTYGSWAGGVYMLEIDKATGNPIYPGKDSNTDSLNFTDRYFGTRISGGYGQSGEGADVVYDKDAGYYYLTVTYGFLTANGGYNMRLFRSKNPQGPYLDAEGKNAALFANVSNIDCGIKIISNYKFDCQPKSLKAAGHNSVLIDENGERYLIHHQRFDNGTEYHEVRVHKMMLNEDGWLVVAPYEYNGETLPKTSYELSKIVGNYQFINHGNSNSSVIEPTLNITLNEDFTIDGDVKGAWTIVKGTNNINLIINGITYKGVLLEQEDESTIVNKVMTFSAIGNNNLSVWGSKISSNDKETAEYIARYLTNIVPNEAKKNIELSTKGAFGTTISWESNNKELLSDTGVVTRGEKDTEVIVKATVTKGTSASTKELKINVIGLLKEVGVAPIYRYDFNSVKDKDVSSTGVQSTTGTLIGNANVVQDEERGNVVEIISDAEVRKENYFKLPENTFNGISAEDGYTVSMWINLDKSHKNYFEHSALFEAKSVGLYPMTRLGANLIGRINSNGAWSDINERFRQLQDNAWELVTFTVGINGIVVYIDGYEVARDNKDISLAFKDNFLAQMTDVRIASGDIWNDKDLAHAKFDNVEFYNKALNEKQVESLYYQETKVEKPEVPQVPEKPSEPEVPENPETPEKPGKPEVPGNPETPEKPIDTENVLVKIENPNEVNTIVINEVKDKISVEIKDIEAIKKGTGSIKVENGSNVVELPFSLIDKDLLKEGTSLIFEMNILKDDTITSGIKAIDKVFEFNLLVKDGDKIEKIHEFKEGVATVQLTLTDEELKSLDKEKIGVFYYNEETKKLELLESELNGNEVTFKTSHFSKFIIAEKEVSSSENEDKNNDTVTDNDNQDDLITDTNTTNTTINNESGLPKTGGNNPMYLVLLSLIILGAGSVLILKGRNKKEV